MIKFLILILTLLCNYAYASNDLTNEDIKDAAGAYGFYFGQNYSLDKIVEKYPNLMSKAKIAKMEFNSKYEQTINNIDSTLNAVDRREWEKIKKTLADEMEKHFSFLDLSYEQAEDYIDEIKERASGNIPISSLKKLLLFNPRYQNNPELEFIDGYTYIYENKGSSKSKGVSFKIKIPITWKASEGERPNVIQKFTEKNGRGFSVFMIGIHNIPENEIITQQDIDRLLNDEEELKELIPYYGNIMESGKLIIEGLPGYWLKYKVTSGRVKNIIETENILYAIIYNDKIISFSGQVATLINNETINNDGLAKYESLFDLIINSFILSDLYLN